MKRRSLTTPLAALSSLLLIATIVLWFRSQHPKGSLKIADSFTFTKTEPQYWAITRPNRIVLCRQVGKDWSKNLRKFDFLGVKFGGHWGDKSMLWNLEIPFALPTVLFTLPILLRGYFWQKDRKVRRRQDEGRCKTCGYDLRATPGRCPECGTIANLSATPPAPVPPRWLMAQGFGGFVLQKSLGMVRRGARGL
jgi:hypothetical protein